MPKVEDLLKQYPGEWLAIEVTEFSEGQPLRGELIYHSATRKEVWEKTKEKERLYIVYAGPPLKEGYAAAF